MSHQGRRLALETHLHWSAHMGSMTNTRAAVRSAQELIESIELDLRQIALVLPGIKADLGDGAIPETGTLAFYLTNAAKRAQAVHALVGEKPNGKASTRVAGHELFDEGSAVDSKGRRIYPGTIGGTGMARCSCGTKSEVLTSGNQRKAWHRAHKLEVSA